MTAFLSENTLLHSVNRDSSVRGVAKHFFVRSFGGLFLLFCGFGCAGAKQIQHFEVVYEDPETGETTTNYYRLRIQGTGAGAVTYKLKAGYLSASTVDVLEGKGPFIPEADLPRAADVHFKNALYAFRRGAEDRALAAAGVARPNADETEAPAPPAPPADPNSPPGVTTAGTPQPTDPAWTPDEVSEPSGPVASVTDEDPEKVFRDVGRYAWFASLSNGDIVSIGQTGSTDPQVFRKLVFYATAKNLDLQKTIGPQIDSMISKVETLARREQQRAEARRQRKQQMQKNFTGLLNAKIPGLNPEAAPFLKTIFGLMNEPEGLPNESE